MTILNDTDTDTDRISRLEGAYEHLATKADVAQMETRLLQHMADMEVRMAQMETRLTWRLIGAVGAIVAAMALIERFLS